MKYLTQLLAVATATTALAVPESLTKRADTQFEDTFDDLSTTIVLPQLFPVGDYHGLAYGGVVVLRPLDAVASIQAHSPPQLAGAAGPIDLLQLGQLTLNTYATITRDSTIKSFDLQSFYFGFGTDTGTTIGLAQPGTLSVVGYTEDGEALPVETFSYAPDTTLNGALVYAELPATWKNLQNVTLAVADSSPIAERTYIGLDNVRHINHS